MKSSQKFAVITVGSTVSLSCMGVAAEAQPTGSAADLLPLDSQGISVETLPNQLKVIGKVSASIKPETTYSPDLLQTVAHNINHDSRQSKEPDRPDIGDVIDLSFVEQFIDENGNVDLPLGITVYEAMGQTSIGFGGDF